MTKAQQLIRQEAALGGFIRQGMFTISGGIFREWFMKKTEKTTRLVEVHFDRHGRVQRASRMYLGPRQSIAKVMETLGPSDADKVDRIVGWLQTK
jgi:hypothetical protein